MISAGWKWTIWASTFFERDWMRQDDLFWNNTPAQCDAYFYLGNSNEGSKSCACLEYNLGVLVISKSQLKNIDCIQYNIQNQIKFWFFFSDNLRSSSKFTVREKPRRVIMGLIGPHFLCWISGVVSFNTWLISSWEENNCCYKSRNWQNDSYFHSKAQLRTFWVK